MSISIIFMKYRFFGATTQILPILYKRISFQEWIRLTFDYFFDQNRKKIKYCSKTLSPNLAFSFRTEIHNMPPKKSKNKGDKVFKDKELKVEASKSPIKLDPNENVLMEVYAKPGAKQNAIVGVSEEGINIQINAPPVEGSANTELVKYIASFLGVKSSGVSLERGHKSRNKVLKISGITKLDIIKKINADLPVESHLPEEL